MIYTIKYGMTYHITQSNLGHGIQLKSSNDALMNPLYTRLKLSTSPPPPTKKNSHKVSIVCTHFVFFWKKKITHFKNNIVLREPIIEKSLNIIIL